MESKWSRRRFVGVGGRAWALLAASGWSTGCSRDAALAPDPGRMPAAGANAVLQRVAYLLFPVPGVGPGPYARVATAIESAAAADARTAALVAGGIAELDAFDDPPWLELDEPRQLESLSSIEGEPFFAYMLDTTKAQLFNDRDVWAHIGFDPAAPVNDIDWLGDN